MSLFWINDLTSSHPISTCLNKGGGTLMGICYSLWHSNGSLYHKKYLCSNYPKMSAFLKLLNFSHVFVLSCKHRKIMKNGPIFWEISLPFSAKVTHKKGRYFKAWAPPPRCKNILPQILGIMHSLQSKALLHRKKKIKIKKKRVWNKEENSFQSKFSLIHGEAKAEIANLNKCSSKLE